MNHDLYARLRKHLDQFGMGFPSTESGIEFELLQRLFTEEEARLYLSCSERFEPVEAIARRSDRAAEDLRPVLERMADKGVLFSAPPRAAGRPTHYACAPWIGGIIEFQQLGGDRELIQLSVQYMMQYRARGSFFRTIPVNVSVEAASAVAPYDDVKAVIRGKERILLAPCACVKAAEALGFPIDQPTEVCFLFGIFAQQHADKGIGRWITQEEALDVLARCEEAGLVHQVTNLDSVEALCNCGKFCGNLIAVKSVPRPSEMRISNYRAEVDASLCVGCGACVERCHPAALSVDDEMIARVDADRCFGCGLCVSVCPGQALGLKLTPEGDRTVPPERSPFWRSTAEFEKDLL